MSPPASPRRPPVQISTFLQGRRHYGWGAYPNNAQGLVVDAVKAVDGVVDFSDYAVDGEVPNLFVVHAGTGAEWNGDPSLHLVAQLEHRRLCRYCPPAVPTVTA